MRSRCEIRNGRSDTDRSKRDLQLSVLATVGRTMIFVPLILTLLVLVGSLFGADLDLQALASGAGALFVCGVAILVLVAFHRFREGLRGEDTGKEQ